MSFSVRRIDDRKRRSSAMWKSALVGLLTVTRPLLQWFSAVREERKEEKKKQHRIHLLKRAALVACAVLFAVILLAGVAKGLVALRILSVQNVLNLTSGQLPTDRYGHTNILLLGAGDASHDGVDLTDSVMIASIDARNTRSVALLSLPRDLYFLHTEKMGKGRINSIYRDYKSFLRRKGMEESIASMEALREMGREIGVALAVDIHHVIKVDFVAFVQMVDALGGLDVAVPADIVDTEYPGPNYTYQTFEIRAGPQHLDGETALKYARSRHTTSDFDRSARQQQLIKAIADNVREQGLLSRPNRILSLLGIIKGHTEMTLDTRSLLALAKAALDIDRNNILSLQLNNQNGLFGELAMPGGLLYNPPREQFEGASVLLPVSIPEFPVTWKQVRVLTQLFLHDRTVALARRPIVLLNAGAKSGSARKLGSELQRFGFPIDRIENAGIADLPSSFVAEQGIDRSLESWLAGLLKMDLSPLPTDLPADKRGPVTIMVGKNYVYTPLQDLVSLPQ